MTSSSAGRRATDGRRVADFIETFCRITKGPDTGAALVLRPWQRDLLADLFELRPDGRRRYRRGLLGLPRKNGKSALGAGIGLFGLFDEPGAEVYSCAGDREQARIVFGMARRMVELDPDLDNHLKLYRDTIEYPALGSVYKVLSAEAFTKEGLNPSLVLFDEVHVQPNHDLWNVMTLGSGTRLQPLVLGITTAGFDLESLCGSLYLYGRRLQAGEVDDETFFFRWWEPEDTTADYRDPEVWAECNPALGDFLFEEDFITAVRQTPEYAFRRYRLNQWTSVSEAWLPHGAWAARGKSRDLAAAEEVVLGFDGSYSGDSTALVACTMDGHLSVVGAWEKPELDDHWRVDIGEVEETIRDACRRFTVLELAMDPYRWQRTMQALEAEGLPVVEFATGSPARMVPACARFYDAVVDGRLSHDGDPRLARHVNNCAVKVDAKGPRVVKTHRESKRRIDLAVAAIIAYERATGREPPAEPSIRFV